MIDECRCYTDVIRKIENEQVRVKLYRNRYKPKGYAWYNRRMFPYVKGIGFVCLSCGVYMGHVQYIDTDSMFSPIEVHCICRNCFKEKIGEYVAMEKMQTPYQPHGEVKP